MKYFMENYKLSGVICTIHIGGIYVKSLKQKLLSVVGSVDGTHFGFQVPSKDEYMFFNRKGFHGLNAMIVSCVYYYIYQLTIL